MRVMVIIDHPWPDSYNFALLRAVLAGLKTAGHTEDVLDLDREGFDPVMRAEELAIYTRGGCLDPKVRAYQQRIAQAEYLVFIFPVWWEVMPALLKGFFDKVFLPGWAFAEADAAPRLTHIRGATVITTMAAPQAIHTSIESVVCKGILGFCGVRRTEWINFLEVSKVSHEQRRAWLAQVEAHAAGIR
ncbi:MAG: NAD(P)H-dependent oxidoreductase [Anaerolineae bacterium]|nr:NAD(P)H-dependent oxidoreductase [Anaerolineae bacterium]